MNLQIIAGQPIKFWVAMEDESDPPIFQAADSTPTLQTLRKNGSSVTPGGGELVIGSVDSPNGYYVTFTPATLPAVGDNYLFTIQYLVSSVTNLLEYEGVAVPSSGGGGSGSTVVVSPVAGNAPDRIQQTTIKAFINEDWSEPMSGLDANGDAINFSSLGTLQFSVTDYRKTEILVIADGSITTTSTTFQVTLPASILTYGTVLNWSLRDLDDGNKVVLYGPIEVAYAADDDGA